MVPLSLRSVQPSASYFGTTDFWRLSFIILDSLGRQWLWKLPIRREKAQLTMQICNRCITNASITLKSSTENSMHFDNPKTSLFQVGTSRTHSTPATWSSAWMCCTTIWKPTTGFRGRTWDTSLAKSCTGDTSPMTGTEGKKEDSFSC